MAEPLTQSLLDEIVARIVDEEDRWMKEIGLSDVEPTFCDAVKDLQQEIGDMPFLCDLVQTV